MKYSTEEVHETSLSLADEDGQLVIRGNIDEMNRQYFDSHRIFASAYDGEITILSSRGNMPGAIEITRSWQEVRTALLNNEMPECLKNFKRRRTR
jgi:hypothetical protein